jgi:ferredoxin
MPTVSVKYISDSGQVVENTYEVEENSVVFDALEEKGVNLPHGCLAGSCGSCRMIVVEGAENLNSPGAIETDTLSCIGQEYQNDPEMKDKTLRLSCRARVKGPVKITTIIK